ncbi:sialidase family protein [Mucilaginibacter flavus]|uniref:sialidase family protein n=1 Tax=Mucilaginibacter flavus TaxID=931504 RepID=UPI0025B2914F|nr:sialidase family protein [Mucilaginibacter flavus]MDN3583133.1 sialidase family protein [Mucilaginibacter flavus]
MIKQVLKLFCVVLFIPFCVCAQKNTPAKADAPVDIYWDQSSLKQVSVGGGNYARMIQLHNGHLLCVYENHSGVQCTISTDLGKNWFAPVEVASSITGVNMAVPEILELKDHSLLVSYNPRPHKINGVWDTTKRFAIVTKKSYNEGKTWKDERVIYQADYRFENGCWEPAQLQLPSGEIQLFYSDEGVYTHSNEQNISIFRSTDGGLTWTLKPQITSFTPGHRDGMPVPILLAGTSEVLYAIEDNVGGQFKPSIIRNSLKQNWAKAVGPNDTERNYALIPKLPDTVYAGAPYLRQLHSGQTLLSYQSTQNRINNGDLACMQVAVGDNEGKNFVNVSQPFTMPLNKHGLWNSLCVLNDDTIIALTSTNAYGSNAIWMIKGHLKLKN